MQAQRHSLVSLTGGSKGLSYLSLWLHELFWAIDYYNVVNKLFKTPSSSKWLQLTSVTWKIDFEYEPSGSDDSEYGPNIQHLISILKHFHSDAPKLREIALHCFDLSINDLVTDVLSPNTKLCAELEKILIVFPTPTISFSSNDRNGIVFGDHRYHFWMGLLRSFFPILAERGALKLDSDAELCAY